MTKCWNAEDTITTEKSSSNGNKRFPRLLNTGLRYCSPLVVCLVFDFHLQLLRGTEKGWKHENRCKDGLLRFDRLSSISHRQVVTRKAHEKRGRGFPCGAGALLRFFYGQWVFAYYSSPASAWYLSHIVTQSFNVWIDAGIGLSNHKNEFKAGVKIGYVCAMFPSTRTDWSTKLPLIVHNI